MWMSLNPDYQTNDYEPVHLINSLNESETPPCIIYKALTQRELISANLSIIIILTEVHWN